MCPKRFRAEGRSLSTHSVDKHTKLRGGMKIDNDLRLDFTTPRALARPSVLSALGDDDEKHPLERRNVKRMKFKMNITPNTARLRQPSTARCKKRNLFERQSHFSLEIKFQRVPAIVFVYDCRSSSPTSVSQPASYSVCKMGRVQFHAKALRLRFTFASFISPFDATWMSTHATIVSST